MSRLVNKEISHTISNPAPLLAFYFLFFFALNILKPLKSGWTLESHRLG